MGIVLFLVFGLIVGLIARAIMPGEQRMGLLMTTVLGVVGSFIGGFLSSLITDRSVTDLHTAGFIGSIIGAVLLLAIVGGVSRRRGHAHI
jgi:uncharacterized membrane protein YeaQ/YmgE (transglycosylase-associated protein family)